MTLQLVTCPSKSFCSRLSDSIQMAVAATDEKPILIIGGGIAGLALGYQLQKKKIPFLIFDRDDDDNERLQGYLLTMQPNGFSALETMNLKEKAKEKSYS